MSLAEIKRPRTLLIVGLVGAFLISAALLAYIQFAGPDLVDPDGYYHLKMAKLIRTEGIPTPFPYLPFTILDEKSYSDHHLLLHIIQIPFTFGDLRIGAKLSAVFCTALAFAVFFWLLRKYDVPYPWFWLMMLFASSHAFLYRMSMPRAPSLSLALQFIASYLILKRKFYSLALLCTIFVWTYNAFPTVAALAVIGTVVFAFTERRFEYKIILASGIGIIAGLVINPYFPRDVLFLWNHIVPKIFATKYQTSVGSEWYPYNTWILLKVAPVAIAAYVAALFVTNREEWKSDPAKLFWFLTATMYLFLTLKSRRFVEYFPPSAIVFLALASKNFLTDAMFEKTVKTLIGKVGLIVATIVLSLALATSVIRVREDVRESPDYKRFKSSSEWIRNNVPANAIVFNTDWDDFPMLFHFNSNNRYIVGLDADFMRLKNEKLYREYEKVTRGKIKNPADEIVNDFKSNFVVTDNDHEDFIDQADKDKRFVKRFSDEYATVYEIVMSSE
jgi:hypothetical protein